MEAATVKHKPTHSRSRKPQPSEYVEIFNRVLETFEEDHPQWRTEALFWIIEHSLTSLRHYIESNQESEISWDSPFVELHYPVEWNWKAWGKGDAHVFSFNTGKFTRKNTADKETATKTLGRTLVKHVTLLALQDFTNQAGFEIRGNRYTPIFPREITELIVRTKGKAKRRQIVESLCRPFSMGAFTVDIAEKDVRANARVPRYVAHQLSEGCETMLPALPFVADIDGHRLRISLVLQIAPLILNVNERRAYYPVTVGLLIAPDGKLTADKRLRLMDEPWARPSKWSDADKKSFWDGLFKALRNLSEKMFPPPSPELTEALLTIKLKVPVCPNDPAAMDDVINKIVEAKAGTMVMFNWQDKAGAPMLSEAEKENLKRLLQNTDETRSSAEKGRALEVLMAELFKTIPGFDVKMRQLTETEEIDLTITNGSDEPRLKREAALILGECKNWSSKCGKDEFVLFEKKLANRRGRCSLGYLISWNGFAGTVTKEMLRGSHNDVMIVPLSGDEIREAVRTGSFLTVILAAWDNALNI